jgi:hypothetical protein
MRHSRSRSGSLNGDHGRVLALDDGDGREVSALSDALELTDEMDAGVDGSVFCLMRVVVAVRAGIHSALRLPFFGREDVTPRVVTRACNEWAVVCRGR